MPDEKAYHSLQENKAILSKNYFSKILHQIFEKLRIYIKNDCSSFIINSRITIRISDERAWHPLQKMKRYFLKVYFSIVDGIFEKLRSCLLLLCYLR